MNSERSERVWSLLAMSIDQYDDEFLSATNTRLLNDSPNAAAKKLVAILEDSSPKNAKLLAAILAAGICEVNERYNALADN